ncbi:VOC family protein [Nocardia salmonicida]|uniref:VOC family protein n=1 Tax=Nocardia salmonicida TaxID=53431 RepID=UPI00364418C4
MSHRSRLCHIVIDVDDLDHATSFWCAALAATEETINDNSQQIYRRLQLPDTEVRLLLQATSDPKTAKSRIHLDIETDDLHAEVHRLEALGAIRHDHQRERGFQLWVLQDPWHNEFCVLQTEFPVLLSQRPTWT